MLSVDGTDFVINRQPGGKTFYCHKTKTSGLRYEIGISIIFGDICWINGPFPCGDFPDIKIFRSAIISKLEYGERVEADDGYIGEAPSNVIVPKMDSRVLVVKDKARTVRSRHETCNSRFKNWKILRERYRHDVGLHGYFFRVIAIMTQLQIDEGERLWQIYDYVDK